LPQDAGQGGWSQALSGQTRWDSFALQNTHKHITQAALAKLDQKQYPDIFANQAEILSGSSDETAHCDPQNRSDGGHPKDLWFGTTSCSDGGVVPNFKAGNLAKAYHNLGRLIHITQDMAVPAHAANIPHGLHLPFDQDGLEMVTDYNHAVSFTPQADMEPYLYYQSVQDDTRRHLPLWKHPQKGCQLWLPSPKAPPLGQDAAAGQLGTGHDGSYGCGGDSYVTYVSDDDSSQQHPVAVLPAVGERQLSQAASYTAGLLMAASKRLQEMKAGH
jgi:hypothetical protein